MRAQHCSKRSHRRAVQGCEYTYYYFYSRQSCHDCYLSQPQELHQLVKAQSQMLEMQATMIGKYEIQLNELAQRIDTLESSSSPNGLLTMIK